MQLRPKARSLLKKKAENYCLFSPSCIAESIAAKSLPTGNVWYLSLLSPMHNNNNDNSDCGLLSCCVVAPHSLLDELQKFLSETEAKAPSAHTPQNPRGLKHFAAPIYQQGKFQ